MLKKIFLFLHFCLRAFAIRFLDKKEIHPRYFSNRLLKKYAPIFSGNAINVSGWDDRDGEGDFYRNYFKNCSHYTVSNAKVGHKGLGSIEKTDIEEIEINLLEPLPEALKNKFDVAFNHTTLEHIFDIQLAFKNICDLSCDAVILIVPVIQNVHIKVYGDFWRMTTLGIAKMFLKNGFEPMIIKCNDQPFLPIYCFAIGVRNADKYQGILVKDLDFEMGKYLYGSGLKKRFITSILENN